MSVAVVLPAGSYRVSDTEVALLQQLLLLLPSQDTFNSVLNHSQLSLPISSILIVIVIYHFYRVHYFSEL